MQAAILSRGFSLRCSVPLVFLATLAMAPLAAGGEPLPVRQGIYFGGGGNYSNVSVEIPGSYCDDCYLWDYPSYDEGDGDYSFVAHLGYRVGRYFAVEAVYLDAGTIGWNESYVWTPEFGGGYYRNEVEFEAQVPELTVLGIFPFLGRWEVFGRFGVGLWSADSRQTLTNVDTLEVIHRSVSDDGAGIVVGLGLDFGFTEALHTRLEYQAVWIDGDSLNVGSETTLDAFTLELQYRFGAPAPTQP